MNKLRKILSNLFSFRGRKKTAAGAGRGREAATTGRGPAPTAAESHAANRCSSHEGRSTSRCTRDNSSSVERWGGMEEETFNKWLANLTGEDNVHAFEYGVTGTMMHRPDPRSERREMKCTAGAAGAGNVEGTVAGAAGALLAAAAAAAVEEEEDFVDLNEDPDVRNAFLELVQQCNCECPAEDKYATLVRKLQTLPWVRELLTAIEVAENRQLAPPRTVFVEGSDALLPPFDVSAAFKYLLETIEN
ncbi:uncharacterized protein, partial [Physeter macrocephalus]|uniref:Uncharacterized protein n=1 Tax=Physeter macrocephalus TaxID=9755 RepID=A0A455B617_PHYMC